jgi:hypothetical protein
MDLRFPLNPRSISGSGCNLMTGDCAEKASVIPSRSTRAALLLIVAGLFAWLSWPVSESAAVIAAKQPPRGIYVALRVNDPELSDESCWSDPNVKGVLLRAGWSDIEKVKGTYDWSYFDRGIALAGTHDKMVMLSISCGTQAPAWIYEEGAAKWSTTGKWHGTQMQPAPWDQAFQRELGNLIAAFGARYDASPEVAGVTLWCGGRGIETFFAQKPADAEQLDRLGGVKIWVGAAEKIIDEYAAAFPSTELYLACGANYPDGKASLTQVAKYALSKGHFGLQSCALTQHFPFFNHAKNMAMFPHTNIPISNVKSICYQFLFPVGTARMKDATTATTIENGRAMGAQCIQVYPKDLSNDPAEASIEAFNQAVGAH